MPLPRNPVDLVWADRPAPSTERLEVHPDSLAGQTSAAKRAAISAFLKDKAAETVVVTALDSIAWVFNVRGRDVAHTPVALAFALLHADGSADLYVDPVKLSDEVRAHLGPSVRLHPRDAFPGALEALGPRTVVADPATVDRRFLVDEARLDLIADVVTRWWPEDIEAGAIGEPALLARIECARAELLRALDLVELIDR